jgi:hypothetical protein
LCSNWRNKNSRQNKLSFAASFAMAFPELLQKKFHNKTRGKPTNTL